jgi:hypothetical protein
LQLLQLQAYLDSQSAELNISFREWYRERPGKQILLLVCPWLNLMIFCHAVLQTFANELKAGGLEVLAPVGPEAEGALAVSARSAPNARRRPA